MESTTIALDTRSQISEVDPRLFGGFAEQLGRCVYEGLYAPNSKHANSNGFRTDVLQALARLRLTTLRLPGGNFCSGYHWQDGVGPREQRPTLHDKTWNSIEPNHMGTDEYMALCEKMSCSPMITVNLGTGTPEEARFWMEYCNYPAGTKYADMRVGNGMAEPYGVKLWALGNEMDAYGQQGHTPAREYAIRSFQTARLMKGIDLFLDRSIELVFGGSCNAIFNTYMDWDRELLEYVVERDPNYDYLDYISLHRYADKPGDDTPDYLAFSNEIDKQIEEMDAVCRFVQGKFHTNKRALLCFGEWGVWYKDHRTDGKGTFAPHLIEEVFTLEDALVVAEFLNSFIRHADILKIANLGQLVNVLAPIQTHGDRILLQSTFYVFEMYSKRKDGISLRPVVSGPMYEGATNGRVHYIDTSAVLDEQNLSVFLVNRELNKKHLVSIEVADSFISGVQSADMLTGSDPKAANSLDEPRMITSCPLTNVKVHKGRAEVTMPPLSVVALTFNLSATQS